MSDPKPMDMVLMFFTVGPIYAIVIILILSGLI